MCEFASWKGYKGKNYFITTDELNTKEGRELLKSEYKADISGHGAIEHYYSELKGKGKNKECIDFSTPDNFPKEIVKAIKQGKFRSIGICVDILNEKGKKLYEKIKQSAWAKYEKIEQPALAEYKKIKQPALAEYEKIKQPALAEYEKIKQSAFWDIAKQKKYRKNNWK